MTYWLVATDSEMWEKRNASASHLVRQVHRMRRGHRHLQADQGAVGVCLANSAKCFHLVCGAVYTCQVQRQTHHLLDDEKVQFLCLYTCCSLSSLQWFKWRQTPNLTVISLLCSRDPDYTWESLWWLNVTWLMAKMTLSRRWSAWQH